MSNFNKGKELTDAPARPYHSDRMQEPFSTLEVQHEHSEPSHLKN